MQQKIGNLQREVEHLRMVVSQQDKVIAERGIMLTMLKAFLEEVAYAKSLVEVNIAAGSCYDELKRSSTLSSLLPIAVSALVISAIC